MQLSKKHLTIGIIGFVVLVGSILIVWRLFGDRTSEPTMPPIDTSIDFEDIDVVLEPEEDLYPDDADRDGIPDDQEIELGLDPFEYDTDRDGLADAYELEIGTDPLNPDTDGDGLTDGQEVLIFDTDPLNPDTDGDGYPDGGEVEAGYSPLCTGSVLLFQACVSGVSNQ